MSSVARKILLVEGRDDREVVYQICNEYGIDNRCCFTVEQKDGFDAVMRDLRVRPRGSYDVVAAIVDADTDAHGPWQSLRDTFREIGYKTIPDDLPSEGLVATHSKYARLGLWLMPDNRQAGLLEDFIAMLAKVNDVLLPRARTVVANIPEAECRFPPARESKAIVHTWLAWQEEPGTPLGQAFTKKYLEGNHELIKKFVAWLCRVFDIV